MLPNKAAVSLQMAAVCSGCRQNLPKRDHLTCSACKRTYDLLCANVYDKRFDLMSNDSKNNWICQLCRCNKPKVNNINTPVRAHIHIEESQQFLHTDSDDSNVTIRKKGHTINTLNDSSFLDSDQEHENKEQKNEVSEIILTELRSFRSHITVQLEQQEQRFTSFAGKIESNICDLLQKYTELKTELHRIKTEADKNNIQTKNVLQTTNSNAQHIIDANQKILFLENEMAALRKQTQQLEDNLSRMSYSDAVKSRNNVNINMPSNDSITYNKPNLSHKFHYNSQSEHSKRFVLYGLNECEQESELVLVDLIQRIFCDIYNIDLTGQIEEIRRMGRRGTRRPVLIELLSKRMTKYITENSNYLKNTGLFASQFLDPDSLRDRNVLRGKLKEARQRGQHAVMRNNKLFINGREVNLSPAHHDTQNKTQSTLSNNENIGQTSQVRETDGKSQQNITQQISSNETLLSNTFRP